MFLVKEILPYAGQKNMLLGTMKNPHSRASSRTNRAFFGYQQTAFTSLVFCAFFAPTGFAQASAPKDVVLRQIRLSIPAARDTLTPPLYACKLLRPQKH